MTLKIALCSCELEECQFCNTGHVNEANELSKLVTRFLHDTKSLCNTILGICNEKEGTSRRGCSNQRKAGWYYLEAEEGITCIVLVEEG